MIASKKLTAEHIAEIEKMPIVYDDDSPQLTKEELQEFVLYHRKYFDIVRARNSIKTDKSLLKQYLSQSRKRAYLQYTFIVAKIDKARNDKESPTFWIIAGKHPTGNRIVHAEVEAL